MKVESVHIQSTALNYRLIIPMNRNKKSYNGFKKLKISRKLNVEKFLGWIIDYFNFFSIVSFYSLSPINILRKKWQAD